MAGPYRKSQIGVKMMSKELDEALQADIEYLRNSHGLNDILFESLLTSKAEARAHIRFFKRMVFISNGAVMTLGLCLMGWGFKDGFNDVSFVRVILGFFGLLVFLWFCRVFVRGIRSVHAVERISRKHGLI